MKKWIALLLAAVMLLSLTACGGSAEPVETTPATTEAAPQVTEEPTEESTEAPTEPRVAPVDFEAVDPATLPEPIPVEEQLLSEDTQTVTLDSLEEYEDLLWSLGFEEVRLAGTHEAWKNTDAYCEPVSLTYNDKAFRFDFVYYIQEIDGNLFKEDGWFLYGTKSTDLENVSPLCGDEYFEDKETNVINLDGVDLGFGEDLSGEESMQALLQMIQSSDNLEKTLEDLASKGTQEETEIITPNYEEKRMTFGAEAEKRASFNLKMVYYPVTGNLYNYMRSFDYKDERNVTAAYDSNSQYHGESYSVGQSASDMCFHYLFPAEDAAE